MACGCSGGGGTTTYVWTSDDGKSTIEYNNPQSARAKWIRAGGSVDKITR